MRISDWSSDVCSSDLMPSLVRSHQYPPASVLIQRRNATKAAVSNAAICHQYAAAKSDSARINLVGHGKSSWAPANTLANAGITITVNTPTAMTIAKMTKLG